MRQAVETKGTSALEAHEEASPESNVIYGIFAHVMILVMAGNINQRNYVFGNVSSWV